MIEFDGMTFDTPEALFLHGFKTARATAHKYMHRYNEDGTDAEDVGLRCSACDYDAWKWHRYCPRCGAKFIGTTGV